MYKLAIINVIDTVINCDKLNIKEQLEEIIEDTTNVEFKSFDNENTMLEIINKTLGNNVTYCCLYDTLNELYACYYVDGIDISDKNKFNNFGIQITSQHISGKMIIVKNKLTYDISKNNIKTNMIATSIYEYDLINVIEKVFVKNGVVIDVDGKMSLYTYVVNPFEHLILTDPDYQKKYLYHEYEVYNYVMTIIVKKEETVPNESAMYLSGCKVNGKVYVSLYRKPTYNEKPPFISLDIDRLNNIIEIRKRNTSLTTNFNYSNEYINFDKLVELELIKHNDKPVCKITDINGELLNI
jgi:hypothetical protein